MTEADYVKAEEMEEGGPAVEGTTPKRKFSESPSTLEITKKIKEWFQYMYWGFTFIISFLNLPQGYIFWPPRNPPSPLEHF